MKDSASTVDCSVSPGSGFLRSESSRRPGSVSKSSQERLRLPEWLRRTPGSNAETREVKGLLRGLELNTVCEEARCPNIAECFGRGTATFMILGDVCTRGCRFCAVTTGRPDFSADSFAGEAERLEKAVNRLGLKHVVITSVARDDLTDGGASGFHHAITKLRASQPTVRIEILTPDFRGSLESLAIALNPQPDIFNHNLETVPRLYRRVRPGSSVERSLNVLEGAKQIAPGVKTKSGIMLGLGEKRDEVLEIMEQAREAQVDVFTLGQYMQPSRSHLPVAAYVKPEEFSKLRSAGLAMGYSSVFAGPLVRSSYNADLQAEDLLSKASLAEKAE